jgi:hypothetical protein
VKRRYLPLLIVAVSACSNDDLPPRILDAVWCDVTAIPCVKIDDPGNGLRPTCSAAGLANVPATAPGGERLCMDASGISASDACAQLCAPNGRNFTLFPGNDAGCVATVNTDVTHPGLSASGYLADACTGYSNGQGAYLAGAGTNTLALSGTLTASYGGANQSVTVKSGQFNLWAPKTDCNTYDSSCLVQLNQLELVLADVSLPGLALAGWSLILDGPMLTPSGEIAVTEPPEPDPTFLFRLPPGMLFDAIGDIHSAHGALPGFALVSDTEKNAVLDLTTNEASIDLSLTSTVDGQPFTLSGALTTETVVDAAPVITPPVPLALNGSGGPPCRAAVDLTADVASPVGLPVTLTFALDDESDALPGPSATGALIGAGAHVVTVFATDSLGAASRVSQAATVMCP